MHAIVWDLEFKVETWAASVSHVWTSECKKYRLHMIHHPKNKETIYGVEYKDGRTWLSCESTMTAGWAPVHYNSMRRAIEAAESHFTKKTGKAPDVGNSEELIKMVRNLDVSLTEQVKEEEKVKERKKKLDEYGYTLGSREARFNACLSDMPKTMADLLEEADLKEKMFDHILRLKEDGIIVKVPGGYKLAGGKKS